MRIIKFRAWDKLNKTMVKKDFFIHNNGLPVIMDSMVGDFMELESCVLMQYTGLKDENGKEIYESDLVLFEFGNHQKAVLIVNFYNAHFIVVDKLRTGHEDLWKCLTRGSLEVIGNLFENPELFKEDK